MFIFILNVTVSADEVQIPFSCWPKEIQAEFLKYAKKLDLSPGERTDFSWGYLENLGSKYKIFTYRSVTPQELDIIMRVANKVELEKRESDG